MKVRERVRFLERERSGCERRAQKVGRMVERRLGGRRMV